MGFLKPDLQAAQSEIRRCVAEIQSPYNDGWNQMSCKYELYQLKCWLDEVYSTLPKFNKESEWEQERLMHLLKK